MSYRKEHVGNTREIMIQCEQVEGRNCRETAYEVTYVTPVSRGTARFGSREKATLFAVEKLKELLV